VDLRNVSCNVRARREGYERASVDLIAENSSIRTFANANTRANANSVGAESRMTGARETKQ